MVADNNYRGEVVAGSSIDHFLKNRGNLEALFANSRRVLKSSPSTCSLLVSVQLSGLDSGAEKLFAKKYLLKSFIHSLKPLFFPHRSKVVWDLSWHLHGLGVPVPEPRGYLVKRVGPFCVAGYFFSEAVSDCVRLVDLAATPEKSLCAYPLDSIIELVAKNVAVMHDGGVTHGDLKWSNILLGRSLDRLWLVDLDSARHYGCRLEAPRVARDLARFVLNAVEVGCEERIIDRFLREYALRRNLSPGTVKESMNKVLGKLARRHERRRGAWKDGRKISQS